MRLTQFGDMTLPQFNAAQQHPVAARHNILPLRYGDYDIDNIDIYWGSKEINANFWVRSSDGASIDAAIDDLYEVADKGQNVLFAKLRDSTERYVYAKLVQAGVGVNANCYLPDSVALDNGYDVMNVAFYADYPFWRSVTDAGWFFDTGYLFDGTMPNFDSGNIDTYTITATRQTDTITNSGRVPIWAGIIHIEVDSGTVDNFRITNETTGEYLEYDGTLANSDVLTYILLAQTARLSDASEGDLVTNVYSSIIRSSVSTTFMHFPAGINDLTFFCDALVGGSPQITVTIETERHYLR